jgi:hypothetical protein
MGRNFGQARFWGVWGAVIALSVNGAAQIVHTCHQESQVGGTTRRTVATAADGSQVAANLNGSGGNITVCATGGGSGSAVVYTETAGTAGRFGLACSAHSEDFPADLSFFPVATGGLRPTLRASCSALQSTVWTREFEVIGSSPNWQPSSVQMAEDGSRVVAWWYDCAANLTRVVALDHAGNLISSRTLGSFVLPSATALSASGDRLFFTVPLGLSILDTATGVITQTLNGVADPSGGVACSANGSTVAFADTNGGVNIFRATNTGALAFWKWMAGYTGYVGRVVAVSADGTTLACGYSSPSNPGLQKVKIASLTGAEPATLYEDSLTGSGQYSIYLTDLACSRAGEAVALGTTGDQSGSLPELAVYTRDASGAYQRTSFDLPGSVYDVDISRNAMVLAVASASTNLSLSPSGASLDAYDLGSEIASTGVPHSNGVVQFEIAAPVGRRCLLLRSDALDPVPATIAGMQGSLFLSAPVVSGLSIADANGKAHVAFSVPGGADIGKTIYFQGLSMINRRLTTNWTALTIVP